MWRHITMVAKLLNHNHKELKQWWWQRQREQQKSNTCRYIFAKKLFCMWIMRFCTFCSHHCTWLIKLPNFMLPLYELRRWTQHKNSVFFSKLSVDPVLFRFNPRKFCQNLTDWRILNKINEVWNSTNSLFKWCFMFVVIQKFCYHGNVT